MVEQRARLCAASETEHEAVIGEGFDHIAPWAVAGHIDSLLDHEVDTGAAVIRDDDIAAIDIIDGEVDSDIGGVEHHIHGVGNTHRVRATVGDW